MMRCHCNRNSLFLFDFNFNLLKFYSLISNETGKLFDEKILELDGSTRLVIGYSHSMQLATVFQIRKTQTNVSMELSFDALNKVYQRLTEEFASEVDVSKKAKLLKFCTKYPRPKKNVYSVRRIFQRNVTISDGVHTITISECAVLKMLEMVEVIEKLYEEFNNEKEMYENAFLTALDFFRRLNPSDSTEYLTKLLTDGVCACITYSLIAEFHCNFKGQLMEWGARFKQIFYEDTENRYRSFGMWPHTFINTYELAENGFYSSRGENSISDEVHCVYCELVVDSWEEGDKVSVEHKLRSPGCPHLT